MSAYIKQHYGNLFQSAGIKSKKATINSGLDSFGWYGTILEISQDKVFDISGYNSIQSTGLSNVHDFLTYASYKKSVNTAENNLAKV